MPFICWIRNSLAARLRRRQINSAGLGDGNVSGPFLLPNNQCQKGVLE